MTEQEKKKLWVMVSGPYSTGADSDREREENLTMINLAAYEVFRRGHVPIVGVNLGLPIIRAAAGPDFDQVMKPLSLAISERCDAVLRLPGASQGADQEVALIRDRGGQVFTDISQVPDIS